MNIKLNILLISTLLIFYSCKSVKNAQQDVQVSPVKPKQVIQTSHGPYHPSKTRLFDLLHTRLEVSFDWQKQYLMALPH